MKTGLIQQRNPPRHDVETNHAAQVPIGRNLHAQRHMDLIQRLGDQAFDGERRGGLSLTTRGEGQIHRDDKNVFRWNQNCHRSVIERIDRNNAIINDATQTCHMRLRPAQVVRVRSTLHLALFPSSTTL